MQRLIKGLIFALLLGFMATPAQAATRTAADVLAPPTVISTSPAADETGVDPDRLPGYPTAAATLDQALQASSVNTSTTHLVGLDGTVYPATPSYNAATYTITLTPASGVFNADTTLQVVLDAGIKAADGITPIVPYTWQFTTRGPDPLREDSGSISDYSGFSGYWLNDQTFGRAGDKGGLNINTGAVVTGGIDPVIFKTERRGISSSPTFRYNNAVPGNHCYTVVLHFAETQFTAANKRLFSVDVSGGPTTQRVAHIDPYLNGGGAKKASTKVVSDVCVPSTWQHITIASIVEKDYPESSGYEILP